MYIKYLKNLALVVLTVMLVCGCSRKYSINFDGKNFVLLHSEKSAHTDGYVNEYIKSDENLKNWTEMIGVYHYPKISSTLDYAQKLQSLVNNNVNSTKLDIVYYEKEDMAALVFLTWAATKETAKVDNIDFNVLKFNKYKDDGIIGLQYIHRYPVNGADLSQVQSLAQSFKDIKNKYTDMVIQTHTPEIINNDIKN